MFSRLVLAAILFTGFSIGAYAASEVSTNGNRSGNQYSEFNHQADGGKFEATPAALFFSERTKYKSNAFTDHTDTYGISAGAQAEYGILDILSVGTNLSFSNATTTNYPSTSRDTTSSGLNDIGIFVRGRNDVGPASLHYGVDFAVSPGKSEYRANGDSNAMSGGYEIAPYMGVEGHIVQAGILGGRATYSIRGNRKQIDDSTTPATETTFSKGNAEKLAVFYEHTISMITMGVSLAYTHVEADEASANGVTSTGDKVNLFNIETYVPIALKHGITLLPTLGYGIQAIPEDQRNFVESKMGWHMGFGTRFAF